MIKCKLCGKDFEIRKQGITRIYCYNCSPVYSKSDKKSLIIRQEAFRKALRNFGITYLGGRCKKCGYNRCSSALAFHHIDPKEKEFNFSDGSLSFSKYVKELDKCILLCANCHAEEHWGVDENNIPE